MTFVHVLPLIAGGSVVILVAIAASYIVTDRHLGRYSTTKSSILKSGRRVVLLTATGIMGLLGVATVSYGTWMLTNMLNVAPLFNNVQTATKALYEGTPLEGLPATGIITLQPAEIPTLRKYVTPFVYKLEENSQDYKKLVKNLNWSVNPKGVKGIILVGHTVTHLEKPVCVTVGGIQGSAKFTRSLQEGACTQNESSELYNLSKSLANIQNLEKIEYIWYASIYSEDWIANTKSSILTVSLITAALGVLAAFGFSEILIKGGGGKRWHAKPTVRSKAPTYEGQDRNLQQLTKMLSKATWKSEHVLRWWEISLATSGGILTGLSVMFIMFIKLNGVGSREVIIAGWIGVLGALIGIVIVRAFILIIVKNVEQSRNQAFLTVMQYQYADLGWKGVVALATTRNDNIQKLSIQLFKEAPFVEKALVETMLELRKQSCVKNLWYGPDFNLEEFITEVEAVK